MHRVLSTIVLVVGLACLWPQLPICADDERLAVFVHPSVPVKGLSENELVSIFTYSRRHWSDGDTIVVLNLEVGTPARVYFDNVVLGMDATQVARFWIDRRIRFGTAAPRKFSASVMAKVVAALPQSIGYAPESLLGPGVRVVARVVNGRVLPETDNRRAGK